MVGQLWLAFRQAQIRADISESRVYSALLSARREAQLEALVSPLTLAQDGGTDAVGKGAVHDAHHQLLAVGQHRPLGVAVLCASSKEGRLGGNL